MHRRDGTGAYDADDPCREECERQPERRRRGCARDEEPDRGGNEHPGPQVPRPDRTKQSPEERELRSEEHAR